MEKMPLIPKVTVLMSVYNGEKYLREAIDSILNQTFKYFEFLIIDDGSMDNSREIIHSYKDPRIRLIFNEKNIGLTKSLNIGLGLAKGEYIARMDADDISLKERLKMQIQTMDADSKIGICGTWAKIFGNEESIIKYPITPQEIRVALFYYNPIIHSSVMIRKSYLIMNNLKYDESFKQSQDYELWVRCAKKFQIMNIPRVLLCHRKHSNQIGVKLLNKQTDYANKIRVSQIQSLNIFPTKAEILIHDAMINNEHSLLEENLITYNDWLSKLKSMNEKYQIYPRGKFLKLLAEYWMDVDYNMKKMKFKNIIFWMRWTFTWTIWRIYGSIISE